MFREIWLAGFAIFERVPIKFLGKAMGWLKNKEKLLRLTTHQK